MSSNQLVFNPTTGKLDSVNRDAFNYYLIDTGCCKYVPVNTEMFVTGKISVRGQLSIRGRVTIWSASDLKSDNLTTVTSSTYTQTLGDEIIVLDATANNITVTLLSASVFEIGQELKLIVSEQGTYSVTVNAASGETISDDSSVSLYKYEVLELNTISTTKWAG